jgi:hypothetical protein
MNLLVFIEYPKVRPNHRIDPRGTLPACGNIQPIGAVGLEEVLGA